MLRSNLLGGFWYATMGAACVAVRDTPGFTVGMAGFVLTNACFGAYLAAACSQRCVELDEVALARGRLLWHAECLPAEAQTLAEGVASAPAAAWPHKGHLRIEALVLRYAAALPLALRGVDMDLRPGESLGVVGRTGAGKSSLVVAITRLVEAEAGRICIDGVDVATVGLRRLRRCLAVISQDPLFFSGSLRRNLDPFEDCHGSSLSTRLRPPWTPRLTRRCSAASARPSRRASALRCCRSRTGSGPSRAAPTSRSWRAGKLSRRGHQRTSSRHAASSARWWSSSGPRRQRASSRLYSLR